MNTVLALNIKNMKDKYEEKYAYGFINNTCYKLTIDGSNVKGTYVEGLYSNITNFVMHDKTRTLTLDVKGTEDITKMYQSNLIKLSSTLLLSREKGDVAIMASGVSLTDKTPNEYIDEYEKVTAEEKQLEDMER